MIKSDLTTDLPIIGGPRNGERYSFTGTAPLGVTIDNHRYAIILEDFETSTSVVRHVGNILNREDCDAGEIEIEIVDGPRAGQTITILTPLSNIVIVDSMMAETNFLYEIRSEKARYLCDYPTHGELYMYELLSRIDKELANGGALL